MTRRLRVGIATLALLVGALGLCEALLRAGLVVTRGVSWLRPSELRWAYYPELRAAEEASLADAERGVDVLLLGASVLHPDWGEVPAALRAALQGALDRPVRLHNLAAPSHTTRDSMIKLRPLRGRPYDVALVYHGINEVRANNAPPELFRADYGHYAWYAEVNTLWRHPHMDRLVAPFAIDWTWQRVRRRLAPGRFVPRDAPRKDWLAFGSRVRTGAAFRAHLEAIVDMARAEGLPVVGATFAYHVPRGYTLERFAAGRLDFSFGPRSQPVELWGRPAHVVRGIEVHNRALRELAAARAGELVLVEMERALAKDGRHFIDPCHLTPRGSREFARILAPALREALEAP